MFLSSRHRFTSLEARPSDFAESLVSRLVNRCLELKNILFVHHIAFWDNIKYGVLFQKVHLKDQHFWRIYSIGYVQIRVHDAIPTCDQWSTYGQQGGVWGGLSVLIFC